MQSSNSDDEFYDAIEDDATPPSAAVLTPGSVKYKTSRSSPMPARTGSKMQEISWADLSTGSTGVLHSDPLPPAPPTRPPLCLRTIAVKAHHKDVLEFEGLVLVQEVKVSTQALLTGKFSPDGRFLAIGGEEGVLRLYQTSEAGCFSEGLFAPAPFQVYREHSKAILDVAWALSSRFLLTAGLDKQAVLWEVDSPIPLRKFIHPDIVSSLDFNPQNANYFSSGCFDRIVRVWNASANKVEAYYQAPDLITAVAYSPSAQYLCVGLKQGQLLVYASSLLDARLKFTAELSCRNRRGRASRGRMITGIAFFDAATYLVSTNDSRLRLFTDHAMKQKYKGHKAEKGPIKATFSHNLVHVVSGSETGHVYIWNSYNTFAPRRKQRKETDRNTSYESFMSSSRHGAGTYLALFAPQRVVRSLQEHSVGRAEVVSHVLVTAGAEGVLRVYYNNHPRFEAH
jgi:WD40 repeat protein